ncbi:MAG: SDR family oxidoreductase [Oscillospiraceae bacterium]|nr:SDR family oxidoreductase [Oscillospiraceae bacterium]
MTALVTGASSGIGREIALKLARKGMRLVISGRNKEKLEQLRDEIGANRVRIIVADISKESECRRLYEEASEYNISIVVNNAGFGLFGKFCESKLERELEMIDVNIKAVHILTKLFLRDFTEKNKGYILNVASAAGFMAGPLMSTYYATKNYVVKLTQAINEELRVQGSDVYVGAFCPGPVKTPFNDVAGVDFGLRGITAKYAAECAVKGMFERRTLIIPTLKMKICVYGSRLIPDNALAAVTYNIQTKKGEH